MNLAYLMFVTFLVLKSLNMIPRILAELAQGWSIASYHIQDLGVLPMQRP